MTRKLQANILPVKNSEKVTNFIWFTQLEEFLRCVINPQLSNSPDSLIAASVKMETKCFHSSAKRQRARVSLHEEDHLQLVQSRTGPLRPQSSL